MNENPVDQIKAKIDIVEYIGGLIQIKKAGRNFKAICPFHNEKTPSFVISPDRQIWRCFGTCGDGGDVISFVMKWENITFYEAVKELAQKTGVQLNTATVEDREWKRKELIFRVNQLTADYYQYVLESTSIGEKAREYFAGRALNPKIQKTFHLGYAPSSWDSLSKFLQKKGFSFDDMVAAGVVIKSEKNSYYDRFRGRIIFPIKDIRGNIIGFSARYLVPDPDAPKYMNTPETFVYHKRESLFGIQLAREAIRREKNVYMVEGEFDMITPYMHGYENVVAIKGTSVTKEQLSILKRLTPRLTMALDGDAAGVEAIRRSVQEAEKQELELQVVALSTGKDPDEALRADPIQFKKDWKTFRPIYDFFIDKIKKEYKAEDPWLKKRLAEEVIPFISDIQNPIVHTHYVKKLADILEVTSESVEELARKKTQPKPDNKRSFSQATPTTKLKREELLQKYILSRLFQSENPYTVAAALFPEVNSEDFSVPSYRKIVHAFLDYQNKNPRFEVTVFFASLPAELASVCDELYLYTSADLFHENILRMALELKKWSLREQITRLLADDTETAQEMLGSLTGRLKEVEKRLFSL